MHASDVADKMTDAAGGARISEAQRLLSRLAMPAEGKLVLLVLDGLGGLPDPDTGLTELETARTPHFDALARAGSLGLATSIIPGVTPGSAPAHLSLFGYDAVQHDIGRGVLSAVGAGIELGPNDVACRINFATKRDGVIVDRRAGRIPTEEGARLCEVLRQIELPGVDIVVEPELQYRAVIVWRGEGLSAAVSDTDPQVTERAALPATAKTPEAEPMAELVNAFIAEANERLQDEEKGNTILMRGFGSLPPMATLPQLFGLRSAVLATYPMYRGLAELIGMEQLPAGDTFATQLDALERSWDAYDYFFIHVKETDAAGEDGDFARKAAVIEEVDELLPRLTALEPDVLVVTGDHSTPAAMKAHSWHPMPVLLSSRWTRSNDEVQGFGESDCAKGSLGRVHASDLMGLMLAHGLRLEKYGA